MTLQQIMYFQRVARSGSFTKAARACFVSQTAISRQICALEEELHVTLRSEERRVGKEYRSRWSTYQ